MSKPVAEHRKQQQQVAAGDGSPADANRALSRIALAGIPGTTLNPLNSSMIAVALVSIQRDFSVTVATVSWLVSGFYLVAAVAQPLMGRIADRMGPRRTFFIGFAIAGIVGVVAPFAGSFELLLLARLVQALGTSAHMPSALAMLRRSDVTAGERIPAGAMGVLSAAGMGTAALGPVIGGFLVAWFDWQSIFVVNIPIVIIGMLVAWRFLPADTEVQGAEGGVATTATRTSIRDLDFLGIALFAGGIAAFLGFVLSLRDAPIWWLAPVAVACVGAFTIREKRARMPFVDLGMLVGESGLGVIFAQMAAVNIVFYTVFYGLPIWLEEVRNMHADAAGLTLLPVAGIAFAVVPLAARMIARDQLRRVLTLGSIGLVVGPLLMLLLSGSTAFIAILAIGAVLGVPNGFNNIGLQSEVYDRAPSDKIGIAGGLLQTARYTGAILATSLIGITFAHGATTGGLHIIAIVSAVVGTGVLAADLRGRTTNATTSAAG